MSALASAVRSAVMMASSCRGWDGWDGTGLSTTKDVARESGNPMKQGQRTRRTRRTRNFTDRLVFVLELAGPD
eukprot:3682810-Rhodomonas_salina.2